MGIPLKYAVRNVWARKLTTALTAGGMALVVFVFAAVQMLDAGLKQTLVATGQFDNIVAIRRSAGTEVQSGVDRVQAAIVESQPEIAMGPDGARASSKEVVVLITLPKRGTGVATNVTTRGVGERGLALRPQIRMVEGRMFRPGSAEIAVGRSIADRFDGAAMGDVMRFGGREWRVVGVFDAGRSGFDSEVWGDAEQLMQAFRRQSYSSVIGRLADAAQFEAIKARLESDLRLTLDVKRERTFYEEQSEQMSNFISYLGMTLSIVFSIGAMIGAMITMYSAVANRTGEIGTLRALGFRRSSILVVFLLEAILVFALVMGVIGGFLPAVRAARLNIVDALRAI